VGIPRGFAGFPSGVGKSFFDFSTPRLFHSLSRRHFFCCRPGAHFMGDLHWVFHGSVAPARACSTGASCDRPAATGAPLWAWAAFVSGPWPRWFLPPRLEPGLQSPPNSSLLMAVLTNLASCGDLQIRGHFYCRNVAKRGHFYCRRMGTLSLSRDISLSVPVGSPES
jgi:hypothetical protein